MNERVKRLREESLEAPVTLSAERAELITDFYRENIGKYSVPMMRARAFEHLCAHKTVHVGEGELIVGERGPAPKAVPTYPELTCHSLEDLDALNARTRTAYAVSEEVREVYRERVIPFWRWSSMLVATRMRSGSGRRGRRTPREIEAGSLTRDRARELLECFWIKFNNQPAPPKVGVTADESGTYNDFTNINLGGLLEDGRDGVNELSYLMLEVMEEIHLLQPQGKIQLSRKNDDRFLKAACRVIRRGYGYPSVFNADAVIEEMVRVGKRIEDAREGGTDRRR